MIRLLLYDFILYFQTYAPTGFDTHTSTYQVSDTYRIHMSIWDTSGKFNHLKTEVKPQNIQEVK